MEDHTKVLQKLEKFSNFDTNWRFGKGEKFSPLVIETTRKLIDLLEDEILDLFPGEYGNLVLTVYNKKDPKNNAVDLQIRENNNNINIEIDLD